MIVSAGPGRGPLAAVAVGAAAAGFRRARGVARSAAGAAVVALLVTGLSVMGVSGCATDASAGRFIGPSASAQPHSAAPHSAAPHSAAPHSAAPNSTAPNAEPWLLEARRTGGPGKGVWTSMTLPGRRTGYQLPARVYVPDAYFDPQQPGRRFPVVLLLAGFPGAIENWDTQGHVLPILDRMMAEQKIPPMILVSPSQNPEPDRDSECIDAVGGARADTYLSQDVPEAIAAHLRVTQDRAGWSAMGYSTGGYCAVDLALRHPERFASAVSLDGYFAPAIDNTTGDLFKGDAAAERSYTPTRIVRDQRPAALRFYLVAGTTEAKVRSEARAFAAAVHAPDTATVVEVPGGHNWDTWNRAMPGALTWLSAN